MAERVPTKNEIRFTYWAGDKPGWRARLGQSHWGDGATISAALDDLAEGVKAELEAIKKARVTIKNEETA